MPLVFAGSAIGQNAGKLEEWDSWKPMKEETLWLLMGGAMDPPKSIHTSDRKTRDADQSGKFLDGIALDLRNMQQALKLASLNFHNSLMDLKMSKDTAKNHLSSFFTQCQKQGVVPVVYYTGHGQTGTGDMCYHDGTISIQEVEDLLPPGTYRPLLISDACYSGHWANYCLLKGNGMHCLAAAPDFSTAVDTTGMDTIKLGIGQL